MANEYYNLFDMNGWLFKYEEILANYEVHIN